MHEGKYDVLDCCIGLDFRVNLHEQITYRYAVTSRRRRFLGLTSRRVPPRRTLLIGRTLLVVFPPRRDSSA
jgi:hypothetical protein